MAKRSTSKGCGSQNRTSFYLVFPRIYGKAFTQAQCFAIFMELLFESWERNYSPYDFLMFLWFVLNHDLYHQKWKKLASHCQGQTWSELQEVQCVCCPKASPCNTDDPQLRASRLPLPQEQPETAQRGRQAGPRGRMDLLTSSRQPRLLHQVKGVVRTEWGPQGQAPWDSQGLTSPRQGGASGQPCRVGSPVQVRCSR